MGRYAILITFAALLGTTLITHQSQKTALETTRERADRQKTMVARQIARSAFQMGVSEVQGAFGKTWSMCEPYEGGSFELSATPASGDAVDLKAIGRYGTTDCTCVDCPRYEISAQAVRQAGAMFSAVTVDGTLTTANLSGGGRGPVISGQDVVGMEDRAGIGLSRAQDAQTAEDVFCKRRDSDVQGANGNCDVVHDARIDLQKLLDEVRSLETTHSADAVCGGGGGTGNGRGGRGGDDEGDEDEWEDGDEGDEDEGDEDEREDGDSDNEGGTLLGGLGSGSPAVVKIDRDCRMSGNSGGTGILYVDNASLTMTGNAQWNGLIVVAGDGGNTGFQTSKGTPRIEGSVALIGRGALDMRGNASIQYNSVAIDNLRRTLGLESLEKLQSTPVESTLSITGRSDCNAEMRANGECSAP